MFPHLSLTPWDYNLLFAYFAPAKKNGDYNNQFITDNNNN